MTRRSVPTREHVDALLDDVLSKPVTGIVKADTPSPFSVVGAVDDAILRATSYESYFFNFTPYVIAAVLFILVAAPLGRLADWYTIRTMRRQGLAAGI